MSVKITDNTAKIILDTTRKSNLALRLMAEHIQDIAEPNTPRDTGDLRRNVLKRVLGLHGVIQWRQKYASILEGKQFANYTTAGTGPHYAENAVNAGVKDTDKIFRKARLI